MTDSAIFVSLSERSWLLFWNCIPLGCLWRCCNHPLKYQNSKFGHSVTIQETMVTKHTDIHCNNLYAAWWVWCENALKHTYERTVLDLKISGWRMTCLCKWPSLPIPINSAHLKLTCSRCIVPRCKNVSIWVSKAMASVVGEAGLREWSWCTTRSRKENKEKYPLAFKFLEPGTPEPYFNSTLFQSATWSSKVQLFHLNSVSWVFASCNQSPD